MPTSPNESSYLQFIKQQLLDQSKDCKVSFVLGTPEGKQEPIRGFVVLSLSNVALYLCYANLHAMQHVYAM